MAKAKHGQNHRSETDSGSSLGNVLTRLHTNGSNTSSTMCKQQLEEKTRSNGAMHYKAEKSTSSNMEDILKLQECHKRNITFKQAFFSRGMVDESIPLKQLSAKEEFSALVNWSRYQLPKHQKMDLRVDMEGVTYQTTLNKDKNKIRVGEIVRKNGPGAIRYDWLPETKYHSLHLAEIEASMKRADLINDAKMKGQELTQEMIVQYATASNDEKAEVITGNVGTSEDMSTIIRMTQMKPKETEHCCEMAVTEEEIELINSFLET